MLCLLVLLTSSGPVQAFGSTWYINAKYINDLEFAKQIWTESESEAVFDALWEDICPTGSFGDLWIKTHHRHDPALAQLDHWRQLMLDHPQTDLIQPCWDLQLTYDAWHAIYVDIWRDNVLTDLEDATWNNAPDHPDERICNSIAYVNIFTHRCDDLPDWRSLAEKKADEKWALYLRTYNPKTFNDDTYEASKAAWDYAEEEINKRYDE